MDWMHRFDLGVDDQHHQWLATMRVGGLAARVCPHGQPAALQLSADWQLWLFAFDDEHCDEASPGGYGDLVTMAARLLRIAEAPDSPDAVVDRYTSAFRDLRLRLDRLATPLQIDRWTSALRGYLFQQVSEAVNRSRGVIPSLNDYAMTRIESGAVKATLMLLDVVDGFEMPVAAMLDLRIRALIEMTCAIVGWDNDIASHFKETLRSGDGQNLLDVLVQEHGCPAQEALRQALLWRDRVMALFLDRRATVLTNGQAEHVRYVEGLAAWISGYLAWQAITSRYHNPTGTPATTQVPITDDPHRAQPVPIPSIAWWWNSPSRQVDRRHNTDHH